ncbi:MAG: hypothetical protein DMG07_03410 [Acidobacteria bacterium]|nr:MAG: hypothetical protein DMG07_03410 [Acidobacteriota bacterium]
MGPDSNSVVRARAGFALFSIFLGGVLLGCAPKKGEAGAKKVIVLGIDGLDPRILRLYMQQGKMPNFALLEQRGGFGLLRTSIPPQSPVAWSNLITGMDPGGHGVFDFIHRDPKTLLPSFSLSRDEPLKHALTLGNWVIPLSGGGATLLRQGRAFWEILDEHGVPSTIFRMPANFPPVQSRARSLAGMGTPDILGTYGIFSFYTDDPGESEGPRSGGQVFKVRVEDARVSAKLLGPYNTFRKGKPQATVDFTVALDPIEPVARIALQARALVLREGEWSDWVQVKFALVPGLKSMNGICRFYLKKVHPYFQLYVTPINIDPSEPALPLSTPRNYSRELSSKVGLFYTQGIAEDTKALSNGILNESEYLEQARMVLVEHLKLFDLELARFDAGLLFFYFSSLDQNSHMFWRALDQRHPGYDPRMAAEHSGRLGRFFEEIDRVLGKAMAKLDGTTTLLVLSDHGFAPFYRCFNLNTWLLENGYIALKDGAEQRSVDLASGVDWSRTRAYGLGLNGLYLNLRGREREGIVGSGPEARSLLDEIAHKLLAVRDPAGGLAPVTRVDRADEVYTGPHVRSAPDLVIGYNSGYRAGWETVLGRFSSVVLEDNVEPWSGDHCIDYTLVPGVVLSNKRIAIEAPALTDVAPSILSEFGIDKPKHMVGRSVFGPASTARR